MASKKMDFIKGPLFERLEKKDGIRGTNEDKRIGFLSDSEKAREAAEVAANFARQFISRGDYEAAYKYRRDAVEKLDIYLTYCGTGLERLFVESVLELSKLSFAVGRGMSALATYLRKGLGLAETSGNLRSHALICLHLGRLLAYQNKVNEGLAFLEKGKDEVAELGDSDILKAAAEFLGLYYSLQGRFREALIHFERAEEYFIREQNRLFIYPMTLWSLGVTLFAIGQVPRALGFFQSYLHSARDMGLPAVSAIARSILGLALTVAGKQREALYHLDSSLKEAEETKNSYSLFIAKAGKAIQAFQEGDLNNAFEWFQSAMRDGQKAKSALIFINLYIFDMLAEFCRKGFEPVSKEWGYKEQLQICLKDQSLHLRGVAMRMRAMEKMRAGESAHEVMEDLTSSIDCLQQAGAALALIDTRIAVAALYLREGNIEEMRDLLQKLWQAISGMGLELTYLPRELRQHIHDDDLQRTARASERSLLDRYFEFLHNLDGAETEGDLFHRAVRLFSQLLGAERGALFWLPARGRRQEFDLRAGYNLTRREIDSEAFKPSMKLIQRAFRQNQYIRAKPEYSRYISVEDSVSGVLCLPIEVGAEVRGILYYDNSYLRINFDFLSNQWVPLLIDHTNKYIAHLLELIDLREAANRLAADKVYQHEQLGDPIITQDPSMLSMLDKAEKAAKSEATVLVTGETGTGKELLVSRIHKQSPRCDGPFIVLDATSIPENLVESELFGHEKGAFTGAESRKRGRIEIAHGGTLFIDEVGELPLQVQVKLLRALESRKFYRVGGTQTVKSDFRLVAATNRRLGDEVRAGRFRQDLFYRLNVLPIVLPPLRERGNDISLLARHFFNRYASKYARKDLVLAREDEDALNGYSWPGNVRELQNVVERAVILSNGGRLVLDITSVHEGREAENFSDTPTMDELQRRYIRFILEKTGGQIYGEDGAASILGMKRSTLYTRMYKLGIKNRNLR